MSLLGITPPPLNGEYVDVYNELVYQCRIRGFGDDLPAKSAGDPVTQGDLGMIRYAINDARQSLFFDPDLLDLNKKDPFTAAVPQINGGKGFLVVPGRYTSTGAGIYCEEGPGDNVPVLWEHITDIAAALWLLQYRQFDYNLAVNVTPTGMSATLGFTNGSNFDESLERNFPGATWAVQYNAISGALNETYWIYYRPDDDQSWCRTKAAASNMGQVEIVIQKVGGSLRGLYEIGTPEAAQWTGTCLIQPATHLVCDPPHLVCPEGVPDSNKNGVTEDGCGSCGANGCKSSAYASIQSGMDSAQGTSDAWLALSDAVDSPLRIGHGIKVFYFLGGSYGQYNIDTAITDIYEGAAADENGITSTWCFVDILRPSGALVRFYESSFNEFKLVRRSNTYKLTRVGNYYKLLFDDGVIHVFSYQGGTARVVSSAAQWAAFECEMQGMPGVRNAPPGTGVTVEYIGGSTYRFTSPAYGIVEATLDSKGIPVVIENKGPADPDTPDDPPGPGPEDDPYNQVEKTETSSGLDAAGGCDFADFFPAGEVPDWGPILSSSVTDYKNAEGVVFAKYIEATYESGHINRGYWYAEGGGLLPVELSMFDREEVEQEEEDTGFTLVLEIHTRIKYGIEGRSVIVRHKLIRLYPGFEVVVAEYRNYGTEDEQSAVYEYGDDPGAGSYGKLLYSNDFDNRWMRFEYDAYGRVVREIGPFADSAPEDPDALQKIRMYDYAPLTAEEPTWAGDYRARTVITQALGVEVAREYYLYWENESWSVVAASRGAAWDNLGNSVNKSWTYSEGDFAGRPWKTENADGTKSWTTYEEKEIRSGVWGVEAVTESGRLPGHGTRQITRTDARGFLYSSLRFDIATGLLIGGTDYTRDKYGRAVREVALDGDITETTYNCCGPRFVTDPTGMETEYAYDSLNRLKFVSMAGVTTFHSYDAFDNEIGVSIAGSEGGEIATHYEYDADGLLVKTIDALGNATLYRRGPGWEETEDTLGGIVRTEYCRDGRVRSVSGSAAAPQSYIYGVEDGELYTQTCASESEWTKGFTDFLGRSYKQTYADGYSTITGYDALGRPVSSSDTLGAVNLQVYDDATGELHLEVVKRTAGDAIDFARDRVTEYATGYAEYEGSVVRVQRVYNYVEGVRTEVSVRRTRRDGKRSWSVENGQSSSSMTDYVGMGEVTEEVVGFDGVRVTSVSEDGLLLRSEHSVLGVTTFVYDEFNRSVGSDHAGLSERKTLDALGRVLESRQVGND